MIIYIQIWDDIEKVKKTVASLSTYRDGPGFRPVFRPTYYYLLNEPKKFSDGSVKLVFEVGTGAKEDFEKIIIKPLNDAFDHLLVEEFLTENDKHDEKARRKQFIQNVLNTKKKTTDSRRNNDVTKPNNKNKWFSINCVDDVSDGWSSENNLIFREAKHLGIEVGWYQVQGSRFIWAHCTEKEMQILHKDLGTDRFAYVEIDKAAISLIRRNKKNYSIPDFWQD